MPALVNTETRDCPECDGSGKRCMSINPSDPEWDCEDCGGSGEIEVEEEETE